MNDESLSPQFLSAREDAGLRAFLEPEEIRIGKLELRPVSLGTLALLEQTRNEFLFPRGPVQEVKHPETGEMVMMAVPVSELFAALAFGYIHSAPETEVGRAAFSEAYFREQVIAWGNRIDPEHLPFLTEEIKKRLIRINQLRFAIKAKPEDGKPTGPTPPPNS